MFAAHVYVTIRSKSISRATMEEMLRPIMNLASAYWNDESALHLDGPSNMNLSAPPEERLSDTLAALESVQDQFGRLQSMDPEFEVLLAIIQLQEEQRYMDVWLEPELIDRIARLGFSLRVMYVPESEPETDDVGDGD